MTRKILALLMALCLTCSVALAEGDDLAGFLELYQAYQSALDSGIEMSFDEFCEFYVTYLSKAGGGQEPTPTVTEEPEPAAVELGDASAYLPDPHYFLREKLSHIEKDITGGHYVFFHFNRAAADAASEYIALLTEDSRFHLSLRTVYTERDLATNHEQGKYYVFDCAGNTDVDDIAIETTLDKVVLTAPLVILMVEFDDDTSNNDKRNSFVIQINYSSDFTFVETDDRCSTTGFIDKINPDSPYNVLGPVGTPVNKNSSGNGGNLAPTSVPNVVIPITPVNTREQCSICFGTGWRTCMSCSGTGRDCPNSFCIGGKVSCTMCGGTGWRR